MHMCCCGYKLYPDHPWCPSVLCRRWPGGCWQATAAGWHRDLRGPRPRQQAHVSSDHLSLHLACFLFHVPWYMAMAAACLDMLDATARPAFCCMRFACHAGRPGLMHDVHWCIERMAGAVGWWALQGMASLLQGQWQGPVICSRQLDPAAVSPAARISRAHA